MKIDFVLPRGFWLTSSSSSPRCFNPLVLSISYGGFKRKAEKRPYFFSTWLRTYYRLELMTQYNQLSFATKLMCPTSATARRLITSFCTTIPIRRRLPTEVDNWMNSLSTGLSAFVCLLFWPGKRSCKCKSSLKPQGLATFLFSCCYKLLLWSVVLEVVVVL